MGRMKEKMLDDEAKLEIARSIAIEAGAISECENHPGTYIDNLDDAARELAYKIGNKLITDKSERVQMFRTRPELSAMIKDAIESSGEECDSCAKWRDA
jgi:hypothetical protein